MTTVLFLCTGNTCRSPMAACLFNALCRQTGETRLQAVSAGLNAMSGAGASEGAIRAMKARGYSLSDHRSQPVTRELLSQVDMVVGMSGEHLQRLRLYFPGACLPMQSFDPPIPDPYGGDDALYEQTAAAMEPQVAALFHLLVTHVE